MLIVILLAVVFVCLLLTLLNNTRALRLIDSIPSAPTVPLLGHVELMTAGSLYKTWQAYLKIGKDYGSPVRTQLFLSRKVGLSKAEHLEKLFRSSVNITKSRDYNFVLPWLGDGLLISRGKKWFKRRKQLTPSFHFGILQNFVPIMNEQSKILVELMREKAADSVGKPFDVCQMITNCTLDIICETAMGTQLESQRKTSSYVQALSEFAQLAVRRIMSPWLWHDWICMLFPTGWQQRRLINTMQSFTKQVIKQRIAQRKANVSNGSTVNISEDDVFSKRRKVAFLESLLELHDAGDMNLEDVRAEVDTFMFEGHDTTSAGLMWSVYCAAKYPECQQKLQEELDEVLGTDPEVDITSDDISQLRYMELFLKESHRMFPPVPWVAREITEEFTVDDYTIPVGTQCNIEILLCHHNPEQFPNPEQFDTDRFLQENSAKRHPFAYVPFSAGARNCIGQRFATIESKIVFAHLVRNFDFSTKQTTDETMPTATLILKPMGGVWMTVKPRR